MIYQWLLFRFKFHCIHFTFKKNVVNILQLSPRKLKRLYLDVTACCFLFFIFICQVDEELKKAFNIVGEHSRGES